MSFRPSSMTVELLGQSLGGCIRATRLPVWEFPCVRPLSCLLLPPPPGHERGQESDQLVAIRGEVTFEDCRTRAFRFHRGISVKGMRNMCTRSDVDFPRGCRRVRAGLDSTTGCGRTIARAMGSRMAW